jgi:outer membrane receptor protein involved in Fe transport
MRLSIAAVVCLSVAGVALADPASAAIKKFTNIPAQDLGSALQTLAQEHDVQLVYLSDGIDKLRTAGAVGDLTAEEALKKLLKGTGLSYRYLDEKTITVLPADGAASLPAGDPKATNAAAYTSASADHGNSVDAQGSKDHTLSDRFRLAQVDQKASAPVGRATPSTPSGAGASSELGGHGLELEEVVVTATPTPTTKLTAPYAISTLSSEELQDKPPRSLVDALKTVPGVSVENSGGEAGGENVVIRGLPWSGFRLLDVLEDGLPLFESNYERELQIDELYRVDLGTERVELVRGGTAPIFSNNASGGAVDFISNHGTTTQQGSVRVTGGTGEQRRIDLQNSGPISDNLLYSVSGFYRVDNGLRDPGFADADKGGQLKVGGTYLFDGGKVWADFKYLNDRGIFYTDLPLSSPLNGASLSGLIDPNYGTLDSNSFRNVQTLALNGSGGVVKNYDDLANGIHPNVKTVTAGFEDDLGAGWHISDKARYANGSVPFNAILNGSPASAATNLNGYLAAAQAAFAGTTSLRYVYAGTNNVFNPATTGGLTMTNTWMDTSTKYRDTFNDLRVTKSVDTDGFGKHEITVGSSQSFFTMEQQQLGNTLLTDVKNNPDALDIQALSSTGQVLGLVTQNGFTVYGSGDLIGNVRGHAVSVYGEENWHITSLWQVDAGVRHEVQSDDGNRGVIGTVVASTTGPLAARNVTGVTGYVPYSKTLDGTSWTVGTSYQFTAHTNGFARYTSTYSLPRLSDQWGNINNGVAGTLPNGQPVPTVPIKQAEIGYKVAYPTVQLFAIAFWSHFDSLNASTYVANATGVLSNQSLLIDTSTKGIEFEGAWRPLHSFEINTSITLQDPTVDSAETFNIISAASLSGKEITRTPKYTATLEPAYLFDLQEHDGRLFTTVYTVGRRYQDFANTSILPAYTTLDAGMSLQMAKSVSVQVVASNLTNSTGLTEGNARGPVANVLPVGDATVGRPIFGRAWTASVTYSW